MLKLIEEEWVQLLVQEIQGMAAAAAKKLHVGAFEHPHPGGRSVQIRLSHDVGGWVLIDHEQAFPTYFRVDFHCYSNGWFGTMSKTYDADGALLFDRKKVATDIYNHLFNTGVFGKDLS